MDCFFCRNNIAEIDHRDQRLLGRFVSALKKIKPKKKTGLCAMHQRRLKKAVKRARVLGIMPFLTD